MTDVNEPRNNEYRKAKKLFEIYLKNPNNLAVELSLKKSIISGEELIYLLANYLNKAKKMETGINSLVEECNDLANDLEERIKDKTGTLAEELKSTIYIYRSQIDYWKEEIEEIKKQTFEEAHEE